jgi:hypothetical protein
MVPSVVLGCGLRSPSGSGVVFYGFGSRQRWPSASQAGREASWGFVVIFSFPRGFSATSVDTAMLCILCVCTGLYDVFVRFP